MRNEEVDGESIEDLLTVGELFGREKADFDGLESVESPFGGDEAEESTDAVEECSVVLKPSPGVGWVAISDAVVVVALLRSVGGEYCPATGSTWAIYVSRTKMVTLRCRAPILFRNECVDTSERQLEAGRCGSEKRKG